MDNQQLCILNSNQEQVIITGIVGDGHITSPKTSKSNSHYTTNCIHKEYLEFKKELLGEIGLKISTTTNNGYKRGTIYTLSTKRNSYITFIKNQSLEYNLSKLTELGIALWFYDDGSLHKNKLFYNLNTHKFTYEDNVKIQNRLRDFNIHSKITREIKSDGRIFYYQRISKYEGAYDITCILKKYPVNCYTYKIWSSETILKWSKLQEQLKSTDKVYTNNQLGKLLCKI